MPIRGNSNPIVPLATKPAPALKPAPAAPAPALDFDGATAPKLEEESPVLEGLIEPEKLATIEPTKRLEVFTTPGALDPIIDVIATVARKHVPDLTTKRGREAVASNAYKVTRCKTLLDDAGKEETAKAKEIPNKIDAARRYLRSRLEALAAEVRKPLTDWEEDQERQKRFLEDLKLKAFSLSPEATSEQIQAAMDELVNLNLSPAPDFQEEAKAARQEALEGMEAALAKRTAYEHEQAELARLREAERVRLEEEAKRKLEQEALDRARKEADAKVQRERDEAQRREREAKEATERAEREKADAERRVKEAEAAAAKAKADADARAEQARVQAIQDERRRQEEAQRKEREAQAAREKDTEHKKVIHNEAWVDLMAHDIPREVAHAVIVAIARGGIRHISITY